MTPKNKENDTVLGFDLSTQKLKAIQLNSKLEVICNSEVNFDCDVPEFRTNGGVNAGPNRNEFFVQPVMWVKAIDMVLDRLVVEGADLSTVVAISGSAQQHGSLFWSRHGVDTLRNLDSDKFLHVQIDDSAFTMTRTPIWMDGSTEKQCIEMEEAIGGRDEMVTITGSKCYPRFTGPQIRKIYQNRTRCYEDTQRISLISSFLASIFINDVAPVDYSDASGMNLFDINERVFSKACVNACAPELDERIREAVPTNTIIGTIGKFFVQRYGFPESCIVTAFTGDNPSALSGMVVNGNSLVISLGTSDTIMMGLSEHTKLQTGHVLCHPTDENSYMGLLCFRNGSLVRDFIKHSEANSNWDLFNELLNSTPRGNYGNMALHFQTQEIIPNVKGTLRWNKLHTAESTDASNGVIKFSSPQTEIRALIEGQMLHRKAVAIDMGFHFEKDTKIVATGGASVNKAILQVMSDVFNATVYIQNNSEAALLGAAYRAKYCHYLEGLKSGSEDNLPAESYFDHIIKYIPNQLKQICEPSKDSDQIYIPMMERVREMIGVLQRKSE